MAKTISLVIVLWFCFQILVPQVVPAQKMEQLKNGVRSSNPSEVPPRKMTMIPEAEAEARYLRRVTRFGDFNLGVTETVDSIILVGGSARIEGTVHGNIFVLIGNIEIKDSAKLTEKAKATVVSGKIRLETGETEMPAGLYREINGWTDLPSAIELIMNPQEVWGIQAQAGFGLEFLTFVTLTLIHMLLVTLSPEQMGNMAYTISHRPIGSTLLGLIVLIVVPYLAMMLILSIVGIPLMLLFFSILLPIAIYGKTAIFLSIGNTIRSVKSHSVSPERSNVISVVVGYSIYSLATWIPYFYINYLTFIIASTIGIGVCFRTTFGQKSTQPRKGYPRPQYPLPRYR